MTMTMMTVTTVTTTATTATTATMVAMTTMTTTMTVTTTTTATACPDSGAALTVVGVVFGVVGVALAVAIFIWQECRVRGRDRAATVKLVAFQGRLDGARRSQVRRADDPVLVALDAVSDVRRRVASGEQGGGEAA